MKIFKFKKLKKKNKIYIRIQILRILFLKTVEYNNLK